MAVIKLKRGELLFSEGTPSKSMFFIQRGALRLFKHKGNSYIEIGVVHSGEVVGEMGFLDGGTRSASAEAIHDCDLVEITNDKMQEQLKILPPWLIVLLKTVVSRLRAANIKIKQLEVSSTAITYGKDGPSKEYAFLNNYDLMKIGMSILLVGGHTAEKNEEGYTRVKLGPLQKFANQILSEHLSKIMELIEILGTNSILKIDRIQDPKGEKVNIYLKDPVFLDYFINFLNDENVKDHTKKTSITHRGLNVMNHIVKALNQAKPSTPEYEVNIAEIVMREKESNGGKDPFLSDDLGELVKNKLCTELSIKDAQTQTTKIHIESFLKMHRIQRILKDVDAVNVAKRRNAA